MTRLLNGRVNAAIWLALGTVYVVWGSTYLAIAVAVRTLPPFLMSSARFLLAGAVLYAWSRRRGAAERALARDRFESREMTQFDAQPTIRFHNQRQS